MIGLPSSGCRRASNQLPMRFTYSSEEEENKKPKANGNPVRRKTVVHAPTQSLVVEIDETPKQCGYLSNRYNHPTMDEKEERREKITINVSGERYQTFVDTLDRFPTTLLGNLLKREQFYDDVEDEYFFDRDRSAFNAILYYYQSNGQLYCPLTVPMTILVTEAKFFQLGNDALKQVLDLQDKKEKEEMPKNKFQKKVWCLFEHPETSRAAHILTLFSMLMILLSVLILCVETLQVFKSTHSIPSQTNEIIIKNKSVNDENDVINLLSLAIQLTNNNMTLNEETITERKSVTVDIFHESCLCRCQCVSNNTILKELYEKTLKLTKEDESFNWRDLFDTCEAIFVAWFTVEFIVRMCACPSKLAFMKNYLNIIDIVSILPFYITTMFNKHTGFGLENFRIIRLIRVFRIFKLSRHSKGLQILGLTLQASIGELGLMLFFLAIGVILFSSAAYYLEDGNFQSIPDAFWWALITMCTVGYGDKVPKSFFGKVVGGACAICGVLSIALPVPVIVSNFDYFYNRERTKKLHESYISDEEEEEGKEEVVSPVSHKSINVEINDKKSPLLNRQKNGSIKSIRSPIETRNDEIQRQATIRGLERRNRKLSQRLSQSSMNSPRKCITGMATTPEEY